MRASDLVRFGLSLGILTFLYGFASAVWGWFPAGLLEQSGQQARALYLRSFAPPDFTVPRIHYRQGVRIFDADRIQPGLTLVTSTWEQESSNRSRWSPGLRLLNEKGRILHRWRVDPASSFPDSAKRRGIGFDEFDIQGSYLFPNGDVLVNVEYLGTARIDPCSRVIWVLAEGNHHSIARSEDGAFWIPGTTLRVPPVTERHPDGLPGLGGTSYQDRILRISESGEILDEINVLDLLYANRLESYIIRANREVSSDITHVNDVEPLPMSMAEEYPLFEAGDLVVSLRHLHLVFVFDPDSRKVKWHESDPFLHQHDPDFTGGGWIGVFDNRTEPSARGTMLGGSRIVSVQPHTDSVRVLYPKAGSEPFYTSVRGKWQQLENGNLLLTEAAAGRILEVTPEGESVWEWIVEPYDEYRTPFVSKGYRLDLTEDDVGEWPCSPSQ